MLTDEVEIIIQGGKGGPGHVSFIGRYGGPDGGDGGRGGDVYVKVTSDIYALNRFVSQSEFKAENGQTGRSANRSGLAGKDLTIEMPVGTFITDQFGIETELRELNKVILLAKGGLGGRGNSFFKSSANTTPRYSQPGLPGEEKKLNLKLKLIADFGLIGLPNAGKSSLLNEFTNADAKVASYPFTTLEPNLGVIKGKVLADIPGLIEGASEGKGLGHRFLKHIEKVSVILHCISSESADPLQDYEIVHQELEKYNPELIKKQEIIILTKSDLGEAKELAKKVKILKKFKKKIIPVSIHDWDSLQALVQTLGI
ncbi:MAG: GTPase ObgE [Candidatus Daviesbacteria bacterium]|nr:GTPase ObgE [Candidatus Daviesbacteria bacterium]